MEIELGHFDAAEAGLQRALAVIEGLDGGDPLLHCSTLEGLGEVRKRRSAYAEAAPYVERSLEILRSRIGETRPELIYPLRALAEIELARGRPAAAVPHARRVLELRELSKDTPDNLAEARAMLARALAESAGHAEAPDPPR